jgi:hypothetical protein
MRQPCALLLATLVLAPLADPAPALARRAVTVRVPAFDVPPFVNREVCTFVPVKTRKPMDVAEIRIKNIGNNDEFTSHHLIVYSYSGDLAAAMASRGEVVDDTACLNFGSGDPTALQLLATSQAILSRQPMPRGTALRLEPGSLGSGRKRAIGLVLNSHWINSSDRTQRARVAVKLIGARSGSVERELKPIFEVTANGPLKVPPGGTAKVGWLWGPGLFSGGQAVAFIGGLANPEGPACVTMLIGHMHRRGTLFTADYIDAAQNRTRLYTNTAYADPPTLYLDPPLLVGAGEKIGYECTHDNATDPKLGCEEEPGVAPGRSVIESFPDVPANAKGCRVKGPNPEECPPTDAAYPGRTFTGNCVDANLVFGFTSEDDMCILPGYYYDANLDAAPGRECDL